MKRQDYLNIYDLIGAAQEVHNTLGRGLEESVYQEALSLELQFRGVAFESQKLINIWYKNVKMEKYYMADFFSNGIIVEIKSVDTLISEHRSQLFNYMRLCRMEMGVLINFGERSLRAERYLYLSDVDDFILLSKSNYKQYFEVDQ